MRSDWEGVAEVQEGLREHRYVSGEETALALRLAVGLDKPLLVEGPPGVGKTDLARAAAGWLGRPLVRLQCYEGLDESRALYEWKYAKQLLYAQLAREMGSGMEVGDVSGMEGLKEAARRLEGMEDVFFSEAFLEPRPLLRALKEEGGAVLLVDEVDKAEQDFEAFLLEFLESYEVTIPELGTMRAKVKPLTILTSNETRELGEAMRRRCLHLDMGYPSASAEREIVSLRAPGAGEELARKLVMFVGRVREMELRRAPSVAESVDWARALVLLCGEDLEELDAGVVSATLPALLKRRADVDLVKKATGELLRNL